METIGQAHNSTLDASHAYGKEEMYMEMVQDYFSSSI